MGNIKIKYFFNSPMIDKKKLLYDKRYVFFHSFPGFLIKLNFKPLKFITTNI